ncbi:uncharacterized protein TNCV_2718701 [Trichonephila clavipes]|nr:uncharacterized protein TNCV_2718701 [Trichonephila clavipes]
MSLDSNYRIGYAEIISNKTNRLIHQKYTPLTGQTPAWQRPSKFQLTLPMFNSQWTLGCQTHCRQVVSEWFFLESQDVWWVRTSSGPRTTTLTTSALNNRRAASPLVRLVEGEERWEPPDHSQGVLPQNWGGIEQNRSVACMVLEAKANDRCKNIALHRDEFRGP